MPKNSDLFPTEMRLQNKLLQTLKQVVANTPYLVDFYVVDVGKHTIHRSYGEGPAKILQLKKDSGLLLHKVDPVTIVINGVIINPL